MKQGNDALTCVASSQVITVYASIASDAMGWEVAAENVEAPDCNMGTYMIMRVQCSTRLHTWEMFI